MSPLDTKKTYWLRITSLGMGLLTSIMSTSILSVLTPEVLNGFNISMETWQIRHIIFFSIFSCLLIFFGKLADNRDPKRLLLLSMCTFSMTSVGSWLSVLSGNWWLFLLFQGLQAAADAAMVPATMRLIRCSFPEERMGWAFGCFGSVLAAGSIIGPGIGSLFQGISSWSNVFLLLATSSVLSLICVNRLFTRNPEIPTYTARDTMPRDLLSGILLALTIGAMQFIGHAEIWRWGVLGLIVFLCGFIVNERMQNCQETYIPWEFFKRSDFATSAFRTFMAGIVSNTCILILPAALRLVYHVDPKVIAAALACEGGVAMLAGGFAGHFADKHIIKSILVGNILVFICILLFSDVFLPPSGYLTLAFYTIVGFAGTLTSAAQSKMVILALSKNESGHGMGFYHSLTFISGAFSSGLIGSLFVDEHANMTRDTWTTVLVICAGFILLNIASLTINLRNRRYLSRVR